MSFVRVVAADVIARHREGASHEQLCAEFKASRATIEAIVGPGEPLPPIERDRDRLEENARRERERIATEWTAREMTVEAAVAWCERNGCPFVLVAQTRHLAERPGRKRWHVEGKRRVLTDPYVARIRELYLEGRPIKAIAARLDLGFHEVRRVTMKLPPREPLPKRRSKWKHTIVAMRAEGATLQEIADALGCSLGTVHAHARGVSARGG